MKTVALCVRLAITLAMGLSVISCSGEKSANTKADVLLRNGAIYTVDAARSWAEAAAIAHGRIIYVGANAGAEEFITPQTHVIDLNGKMVLPGFHDSHVHPVSGGIELGQCNLNGLQTQQEIFDAVREYAQKNPALPWIVGGGWDLPIFPNANPTKQQLDQLVSDRPAFLSAADGHSAWVNSKALELAGITAATADPPEGRIERDPLSKEPTGTLRERATDLVSKHIPPLTSADYLAGAKRGLAMANRFGITSFQEASATPEILAAYDSLDRSGELTARVVAAMYVDPAKDEAQIEELKQKRSRYRGKNLRADAVTWRRKRPKKVHRQPHHRVPTGRSQVPRTTP